MLDLNPEALELEFQEDLAAAHASGEDGGVVAEQGGGQAEVVARLVEGLDHIQSLDAGEGGGAERESGVVVDEVQDLDRRAIGQAPGCGIDLPGLVGQLGLEADVGATRPLVGLRSDPAVGLEDAPDCGRRGQIGDSFGEVIDDGLGAGIVASRDQFVAQSEDLGLDGRTGLGRT